MQVGTTRPEKIKSRLSCFVNMKENENSYKTSRNPSLPPCPHFRHAKTRFSSQSAYQKVHCTPKLHYGEGSEKCERRKQKQKRSCRRRKKARRRPTNPLFIPLPDFISVIVRSAKTPPPSQKVPVVLSLPRKTPAPKSLPPSFSLPLSGLIGKRVSFTRRCMYPGETREY